MATGSGVAQMTETAAPGVEEPGTSAHHPPLASSPPVDTTDSPRRLGAEAPIVVLPPLSEDTAFLVEWQLEAS